MNSDLKTEVKQEELTPSTTPQLKQQQLLHSIQNESSEHHHQDSSGPSSTVIRPDDSGEEVIEIKSEVYSSQDEPKVNGRSRVVLSEDEMQSIERSLLIQKWKQQNSFIDSLENRLKQEINDHQNSQKKLKQLSELKIKLTQDLQSSKRKESILIMRLSTKEQEMQELRSQQQKDKSEPGDHELKCIPVDPAVDLMFQRFKREMDASKSKVEEMQNELSAWKFTPDSNTGKRLMAKCRLLQQENEDLGRMISSGRVAKIEGDLALQKKFSDDIKKSQSELDEFLVELDEDFEGMQNTIYVLQQQLKESKEQLASYHQQQLSTSESNITNEPDHQESSTQLHPNQKLLSVSELSSPVVNNTTVNVPEVNNSEDVTAVKSLSSSVSNSTILQKLDSGYAGNGSTDSNNSLTEDDLSKICSRKRTIDSVDATLPPDVSLLSPVFDHHSTQLSSDADMKQNQETSCHESNDDSVIPVKKLRTSVSDDNNTSNIHSVMMTTDDKLNTTTDHLMISISAASCPESAPSPLILNECSSSESVSSNSYHLTQTESSSLSQSNITNINRKNNGLTLIQTESASSE